MTQTAASTEATTSARSFVRPPALGGSEQAPIGAAVPNMRTTGALRSGRPLGASRQRYLTVTLDRKPPITPRAAAPARE